MLEDQTPKYQEQGQGLVEYALILVLVALVVIVIVALFGDQLANTFDSVACSIELAAEGNVTQAAMDACIALRTGG